MTVPFTLILGPPTPGLEVAASDLLDCTIRYGRDSVDSDMGAATLQATIRNPDRYYSDTEWGAEVSAAYLLPPNAGRLGRFTGDVTDRVVEWQAPDDSTRYAIMRLTAVSRGFVWLARTVATDDDPTNVYPVWGQETDADRIRRMFNLAGLDPAYQSVDPGGTMLAAWYAKRITTGDMAQLASTSGGGLLVEQPGRLEWHDRGHRARQTVALRFPADLVLVSPSVEMVGPKVNRVRVTYGASSDPNAGARPTVTAEDTDAQARYGLMDLSVQTEIVNESDAALMADYWLGRRARPAWAITRLAVLLYCPPYGPGDAFWSNLMTLKLGQLVAVDDLPSDAPVSGGVLYVEGWTDHVTPDGWTVELNVSDWALSNTGKSWADVAAADTWASQPADLTWETYDQPPAQEVHAA
jgi:hypothetical protein